MTFLTPDQVAERYQVSLDTLKEWRIQAPRAGVPPHRQAGPLPRG